MSLLSIVGNIASILAYLAFFSSTLNFTARERQRNAQEE
jgi:hypothetical protein